MVVGGWRMKPSFLLATLICLQCILFLLFNHFGKGESSKGQGQCLDDWQPGILNFNLILHNKESNRSFKDVRI